MADSTTAMSILKEVARVREENATETIEGWRAEKVEEPKGKNSRNMTGATSPRVASTELGQTTAMLVNATTPSTTRGDGDVGKKKPCTAEENQDLADYLGVREVESPGDGSRHGKRVRKGDGPNRVCNRNGREMAEIRKTTTTRQR